MKFTVEQIAFFKKHRIPIWYVLDSEWLKPKEYKKILNDTWYLVAMNSGSKECENATHNLRLRDRHWRCVECRVSNYSFIKSKDDWYMYIAWTIQWKLLKVWYTTKLEKRAYDLKHDWYWWYNDWEMLYYWKYMNALSVENMLHNRLSHHWVSRAYSHYWKTINCYELFECSYIDIEIELNELNTSIWNKNISDQFYLHWAIENYNFKNKNKDNIIEQKNINIKYDYEQNNTKHDDEDYDKIYDLYLKKYWIF